MKENNDIDLLHRHILKIDVLETLLLNLWCEAVNQSNREGFAKHRRRLVEELSQVTIPDGVDALGETKRIDEYARQKIARIEKFFDKVEHKVTFTD